MLSESTDLVSEADALLGRLNIRLAECFTAHPHLGEVPKPGMARRIRRLKQVCWRAERRLNRRKYAAGIPTRIAGAMWMINQADAGYF